MSRALVLYPLYRVRTTGIPFLRALGRTYPLLLKAFAIFLFLINVRSWPLTWHLRVWRPVFLIKLRYILTQLSCIWLPRKVRNARSERFLVSLSPVGSNPLEVTSTYKTWAGPDDCDFNFHLSNSSYAKNLDAARFKTSATFFPALFSSGGFVALGATHYTFLREIPMFAKYEMISNLFCWDHKWIYILTRFITRGENQKNKLPKLVNTTISPALSGSFPPYPPATATSASTSSSPVLSPDLQSPGAPLSLNMNPNNEMSNAHLRRFIASETATTSNEGSTLNCVAVSRMCFKFGRITCPPSLVLACEGFTTRNTSLYTKSSPSSPSPYSHTNPPPHYTQHVLPLRDPTLDNGTLKRMHKFLKGGWKDVPEKERWWDGEEVLGGAVEERRKENVELMQELVKGMDGLRETCVPLS